MMCMQSLMGNKLFSASAMPVVYSITAVADPIEWWQHYGNDVPQLQEASTRVLTVPPTASGGERNWSAFSHIWSEKRSRMLLPRVYRLVYIYFNTRALKRTGTQPSAADFEAFLSWVETLEDAPIAEAESDDEEP